MPDNCGEPEYSDDPGSIGESDSGEGVRDLAPTHAKIWWAFILLVAIAVDQYNFHWIAEEHGQVLFLATIAYIGSTILEVAAESVASRNNGLISRVTDWVVHWVVQPGSQDKEQTTKTVVTGSVGFLTFVSWVSLDVLFAPIIPVFLSVILIFVVSVFLLRDKNARHDMRSFARAVLIFSVLGVIILGGICLWGILTTIS